jgi:UPF0755 protein
MRYIRALMLGVALVALVVACSGYVLLREIRAPAGVADEPVEVTIEQGDSTSMIATKLSRAELIRQPILFTALVRTQGLDGKLQAGSYLLRPSMTMAEIIGALQNSRVSEIMVTIPEGLRLEEIAARVAASGVIDEAGFLSAARNADPFREQYFLLQSLPAGASLEGYLFPDTYRISATSTVTSVLALMLDRFSEQYATIEKDVRVPNRSVHEIVTMASIVQREAVLTDEMPRIAAVFWNRLDPERGAETVGRLGADPTVQYALGYSQQEQTWWRKELTAENLAIASPYNTRENAGLPPGPIAAPGVDALRAAAQPLENSQDLYFVASCARDGSHQFAATFEEFQQYEAAYLACSGGGG